MILRYSRRFFFLASVFLVLTSQMISLSTGIDAKVSLNIEEKGFHRNFVYRVDITDFDKDNCHLAIYLELPSALYVNVDELAEQRRLGISTACSLGETDVELFMEKAKTQNITVCAPYTKHDNILRIPIHQRYQYAKKAGGYVHVIFPRPKLLLGCKERIPEYRISKTDLCSPCVDIVPKWREIPYSMEQGDYDWLVPVGDSSLLTMITYVTLFVTILGGAFITRTIWRSSIKEHQKED